MWIYEFWIGNDPEYRSRQEDPDCTLDDFKDDDPVEFYQKTLKVYLQYLISSFGEEFEIWYRPIDRDTDIHTHYSPKRLPKAVWLEF